MKTELIETSCLGCVIRIIAFRDEDERMNSAHITWLSDHSHLYQNSWKGRLSLAWMALRGKPIEDIDLDTTTDIAAFDKAWRGIVDWLNSPGV